MKVAIMQPYIFPYIGYFQLLNFVDQFVIYDNIQFTKKGWINRNRILSNGKDEYISIPLKKGSDYANIDQRFLSDDWANDKKKIFNKIKSNYEKAPYFKENFHIIEDCLNYESQNLFDFIFHSLQTFCSFFDINTKLLVSSQVTHNSELKSAERVISICKSLEASQYINPIGGKELYDYNFFSQNGITLNFLEAYKKNYPQFNNEFVPYLSIIDMLFFLPKNQIKNMINNDFKLS